MQEQIVTSLAPNIYRDHNCQACPRLPSLNRTEITEYTFATNLSEFFDVRLGSHAVPLANVSQILATEPKDFGNDKPRCARETILWGRKSGSMLTLQSAHHLISRTVTCKTPNLV